MSIRAARISVLNASHYAGMLPADHQGRCGCVSIPEHGLAWQPTTMMSPECVTRETDEIGAQVVLPYNECCAGLLQGDGKEFVWEVRGFKLLWKEVHDGTLWCICQSVVDDRDIQIFGAPLRGGLKKKKPAVVYS